MLAIYRNRDSTKHFCTFENLTFSLDTGTQYSLQPISWCFRPRTHHPCQRYCSHCNGRFFLCPLHGSPLSPNRLSSSRSPREQIAVAADSGWVPTSVSLFGWRLCGWGGIASISFRPVCWHWHSGGAFGPCVVMSSAGGTLWGERI